MADSSSSGKAYAYQTRIEKLQPRIGTVYPAPLDAPCATRQKTVLGDLLGLSQFGVNLLVLQPGGWSAQRHWHKNEDEFIYVLEGEVTLVTDEGELVLQAGGVAGFPAGQENGHHLVNKSGSLAKVLEVGTRAQKETVIYPDADLKAVSRNRQWSFLHKDGEPYE